MKNSGCDCSACETEEINKDNKFEYWTLIFVLVISLIAIGISIHSILKVKDIKPDVLLVDGYTLDQWADAIGKAENSTNYPYGIMIKYKNTTPRQACKNTVWNNWERWNDKSLLAKLKYGKFSSYLSSVYCPKCPDWERNVKYFLAKDRLRER